MPKTIQINGEAVTPPPGAVAWKYADPTEDARWMHDMHEAADVAREDPGLVAWVPGPLFTVAANGGRGAGAMPDIILAPTACESLHEGRGLLLGACRDARQGYAEGCLVVTWPEHQTEAGFTVFTRHMDAGAPVEQAMTLAHLAAAVADVDPCEGWDAAEYERVYAGEYDRLYKAALAAGLPDDEAGAQAQEEAIAMAHDEARAQAHEEAKARAGDAVKGGRHE